MIKNILIILLAISFISCNRLSKKELEKMLDSEKRQDNIKAIDYIKAHKDTTMVKYMLKDGMDPRITHYYRYLGMSIYQIKMYAMEKLTGKISPKKITRNPDSTVYKYYLAIAKERGWMK